MAFDPFALFRESDDERRRREERERIAHMNVMFWLGCFVSFFVGLLVGYLSC